MKVSHFLHLSVFGLRTVLFKSRKPILATIILTDACNLACVHCGVNNIKSIYYPYPAIRAEMEALYREGIRILFFCGGEPFLWQEDGKTIRDLVREAREIGFFIVNVVTNGTIDLDIPEADLVLLSIDGTRRSHNGIRGDTFDQIFENVQKSTRDNICVYMAINTINYQDITAVADIARQQPKIRAISFNFHTPYPGTEPLTLSSSQKAACVATIRRLMGKGYPVFNLASVLEDIQYQRFKTPCYQCIVSEEGKRSVCGRCVDIEGLCQKCGYFFAAEYALIFDGRLDVIFDMLKTYLRYV
jgi:Fe-coproporphyrin III synthase